MGTAFSAMLLSSGVRDTRAHAQLALVESEAATAVAAEESPEASCSEVCLEPVTRAYPVEGYFTGVRSTIVVPQRCEAVFESLSKDMQLVFGPIAECRDVRKDADGCGWERLHRHVRIPFAISYFSGTINLKLDVENNRHLGQIQLESLGQGKFLTKLVASFHLQPSKGADGKENTSIHLDSKLIIKRLPPPPLKSLVKGVVLRKMDKCMRDLADFHSIRLQPGESLQQQQQPQEPLYLPRLANNIQPTPALMRALSTERRAERSSLL